LLELAPGFFGVLDHDGRVRDLNARALAVIAATRAEVIGTVFWEQRWWASLPASAARIREAVLAGLAGQPATLDLEYHACPDGAPGETRWVAIEVTPVPGDSGAITRVGVSGIDVTERVADRRALDEERAKLAAVFEVAPAAMALWRGGDLVFERVNPAYQAIFGERPLVGLPLTEALPELDGQLFPGLLGRVFQTGESFLASEMLALVASAPDTALEEHYYDFSYVRIDVAGAPYGVFDHAIDVTERVRARRELVDDRQRLADAVTTLEAERSHRERIVIALTHDLRTSLGAARLRAEMMRAGAANQALVDQTTNIVASIDRCEHMIGDLLDASRLKAGEQLSLDLAQQDATLVVRAAVDDAVRLWGPRFTVRMPELPVVGRWDTSALRRIVENLTSNAAKYGAAATPITIQVDRDPADLVLRVHNHGEPIPVDEQARLFELFRRAPQTGTRAKHGWGIGLSLVRGLAIAHGGDARVRSAPGEGTTFTVRLPSTPFSS